MALSPQFKEYLEELFEPVAPVTIKRMFGGAGVFKETPKGRLMFALVADEVIYLKAGDGNRAAFEERDLEPFVFESKSGKRGVMSYHRMPEACFDDPDELKGWALAAVDAAIAAKD